MDIKPKTDIEIYHETVVEQFIRRRRYATQIAKIDNAGLHAGQPMYFYCKECGVPTEVLPEDYLYAPFQECSQCAGLKREGLLETAKRKAEAEEI